MAPLFCSRLRAIRTHFSRIGLSTGHQFSKIQLRWIGKFIFFNKVLFRTHPDDLEPALDGRTGLPT